MLLTNFNKIDISSKNQKFEDLDKTNLRDAMRDLYDQLVRRPIYKVVYKNFFKKQNYKIDYTIPARGLSTLKRFEILNDFKKIQGLSILNIGCGNALHITIYLSLNLRAFMELMFSIMAMPGIMFTNMWIKII